MAALHALAGDNGKIKGIATIATPYIYRQKLQNKFLEQAIAELATALLQIQSKSTRITSFYGVYDQVVPPNDSHLDNIHSVKRLIGSRIANITHEQLPTIGKALDDRLPLYSTLVYQFSIKAVPEEEGADVGGRRAARLSTRAIQLSARTALLAVLIAAHNQWPARLIISCCFARRQPTYRRQS